MDSSKIEGQEAALVAAHQQIQSLQNMLNNRSIDIEEVRKQNQRLQSSGDLQATLGEIRKINGSKLRAQVYSRSGV